MISPSIHRELQRGDHTTDPTLVQIVLEGTMATYAHRLCSAWDLRVPGRRERAEGLSFEDVYDSIKMKGMISHISQFYAHSSQPFYRSTEPLHVSGRWRTLTRTHLKILLGSDNERQRKAEERLIEHIVDVLLACSVRQDVHELRTQVRAKAFDDIHDLTRLALEFLRMTGDVIASRDLYATLVQPGVPFDGDYMVDEWSSAKGRGQCEVQGPSPVLCTTQLGIRRDEVIQSAEEAGCEKVVKSTLISKPQVTLETILEELEEGQGEGPEACY